MAAYERGNPRSPSDLEEPTQSVRQVDRTVTYEESQQLHPYANDVARRVDAYRRIAAVIWTLTAFVEIIVGLRVVFKFIGANAGNGFVNFIYSLSGVFVNPFLGMVRDVSSGSSVLEINSLIAMLIFVLIAWGVLKLVWLLLTVTEPSAG